MVARYPTPTQESLRSADAPPTLILSFESLDAASNLLARSLRSLGVRKGDRVAASLGNMAEHVILTYALFKLGAVLAPLNPGFNAAQVAAALEHLAVEVLVITAVTDLAYKPCRGRSNLDLLTALLPDLRRRTVESPSVPTLRSVVVVDNRAWHPEVDFPLEELPALTRFEDLLPSPLYQRDHPSSGGDGTSTPSFSASTPGWGTVTPDAPLSADETINIQFTSGTTSRPKAAMLSHGNVLNNGRLIAARMGLDPGDRIVCPPPLFHCFGSVLGLMATATTGAAILFPSPAFDPAAALRMATEHCATGLYGVTTMFVAELELLSTDPAFAALLRDQRQYPRVGGTAPPDDVRGLEELRKGIAAGSSVPEALMRRLYGALGLRDLVICYGMTETSPVSAMTAPGDPPARRAASVGRAMPHTALKVVDPGDRARVLPRGERGELAVAGYLLMRGYYGDEAQTREVLIEEEEEGDLAEAGSGEGTKTKMTSEKRKRTWMYTGDEARIDDEGYVEITGRIKDLIIRGGENVHPLEIENCLIQHPLVQDASVVGVPDRQYGEVIAAFVVPHHTAAAADAADSDGKETAAPRLSEDALREWVATNLSSHLVPKHVFWLDEYPKTASGKIQKFKLREMARELAASG